eukprot:g19786.t1
MALRLSAICRKWRWACPRDLIAPSVAVTDRANDAIRPGREFPTDTRVINRQNQVYFAKWHYMKYCTQVIHGAWRKKLPSGETLRLRLDIEDENAMTQKPFAPSGLGQVSPEMAKAQEQRMDKQQELRETQQAYDEQSLREIMATRVEAAVTMASQVETVVVSCTGEDKTLRTLATALIGWVEVGSNDGRKTYRKTHQIKVVDQYYDVFIYYWDDKEAEEPARNAPAGGSVPQWPFQAAAGIVRWWRGTVGAQILSDVDDTIKCSGGPRGGGVDEAGYRKEVYPGAVQFMLELARGRGSSPRLVRLLSARPKKLGFLRMKPKSRVALEFQRSQYGRLRDLLPALRGDFRKFGATKLRNWEQVLGRDIGQAKAIFIGDDGQGDVQAALKMASFGPPFVAAFIHQVSDKAPLVPHSRVLYFQSYLQASQLALQRRLISREGVERVKASVEGSNLVRLCRLHAQDPRRYSKYPCRREGGLFWPDGSKADLHLKDDQTVRIRSCGFPKAHPEIDRGGRCGALLAELDHMTVQEKIDLMISALKTEQANEVKKKDYCVAEFNQNRLAADAKKRQGEGLNAASQEVTQQLKALLAESKDTTSGPAGLHEELEGEVLELQKQQKLAAQNREKENAEFQKVVQEQRETQVLLKKAMHVLQEFYAKPESLLQEEPEPETFGSYKKNNHGQGVMLMLQELAADAKEMEAESSAAEREAQADYEAFGKDSAAEQAKMEEKLVMTRKSQKGVEQEVSNLADTKLELHEACDFTLQNFDTRQKARGEEVEALFDAKAFLKGAQ